MNYSPNDRDLKRLLMCEDESKRWSTCAKRQYYSIIVDRYNHIIGSGYNGVPSGMLHCIDGGCPRFIQGSAPGSSYDNCYSIHAEANAILHSDYLARREGCTLYVNGSPCFSCAKLISNSGVNQVVCLEDPSYVQWPQVKGFLEEANVRVLSFEISYLDQMRRGLT